MLACLFVYTNYVAVAWQLRGRFVMKVPGIGYIGAYSLSECLFGAPVHIYRTSVLKGFYSNLFGNHIIHYFAAYFILHFYNIAL